MVVVNTQGQEINAKIVYYGPALSGKTTNLEQIYERMPSDSKGKMVSMKTRTDRTLFFDFLPIELGDINGYRTRMLLYTVPGQVYYNATRKLVLKGVDAVVFVADSAPAKLAENIESLRNLEENLNELGLTLDTLPWVIQYNKRDLPDAVPVATLESELNLLRVPSFEAVATQARGVYETFRGIAGLLFTQLASRLVATGAPAVRATAGTAPDAGAVARGMVRGVQGERDVAPQVSSSVPNAAHSAAGGGVKVRRVELPSFRSVEPVLDEIDHVAPATATGSQKPVAPGAQRPAGTASSRRPNVAQGSTSSPITETQGDGSFRFVALETAPIDDNVGRVLDLDRDSGARDPKPKAEDSERDFITDPCRGNEREAADDTAGSTPAADPLATSERAARLEDECVITVPVLLSRSQTRKTIPIKLRLEIQITDDEG